MDYALFGQFRLSQETDNQTKVYAVLCKKKEEVRISSRGENNVKERISGHFKSFNNFFCYLVKSVK